VIIRWLDLAEKDLDDLFSFVARDSLTIAEKEVDRVIGEVARLQSHPGMGRPGRVPETRELVIRLCPVKWCINHRDHESVQAAFRARSFVVGNT